MRNRNLFELLAALEHEQWQNWTQICVGAEKDNNISLHLHKKWSPNWKPYNELEESTKDYDRYWAKRVLELFRYATIGDVMDMLDDLKDKEYPK